MKDKIKVLFLIHDLGQGGAEKVLVNLVNNMDSAHYDISVIALFGGGVNEQALKPHVHYRKVFPKSFPGNSHLMKLLSPKQLHRLCLKERYDIEVSYLEGPTSRIISGCTDTGTKLVSWIHSTPTSMEQLSYAFRSPQETLKCYNRFDRIVAVSQGVRDGFVSILNYSKQIDILHNTLESKSIRKLSREDIEIKMPEHTLNICVVGKIVPSKGFMRLAQIHARLLGEGYAEHIYALGSGTQKVDIEAYLRERGMLDSFTFLGYQTNPYKYIAKCDMFVCASYAEGFSTAATEALIVGTPVCTVEVSGMKEMLGKNNEYGIVVENSDEALYEAIKRLHNEPSALAHYKNMAILRGNTFSTESTVEAVQALFESLLAGAKEMRE